MRDLCLIEPINEWSGILVYEVVGSIKDMSSMKIYPRYIKLMDIGTKAYTEYDFGAMAIEVFDEYPDALNTSRFKLGHIHSHNTMNVFFSPTDMSELTTNCQSHAMYLSVIVNNRLDVEASIGVFLDRTIEAVNTISYEITDVDGSVIAHKGSHPEVRRDKLCLVYNCRISRKSPSRSKYFNVFLKNVTAIIASKKAKAPVYPPYVPPTKPKETVSKAITPLLTDERKPYKSYGGNPEEIPLSPYQKTRVETLIKNVFVDSNKLEVSTLVESIPILAGMYGTASFHEKENFINRCIEDICAGAIDIGITEAQSATVVSMVCRELQPYRTFIFVNRIVEDLGVL